MACTRLAEFSYKSGSLILFAEAHWTVRGVCMCEVPRHSAPVVSRIGVKGSSALVGGAAPVAAEGPLMCVVLVVWRGGQVVECGGGVGFDGSSGRRVVSLPLSWRRGHCEWRGYVGGPRVG